MNDYNINKSFWQSKKWWMAIIAALIPVIGRAMGWELNTEEILAIVSPIVAYILAQAFVDANH